MSPTEILDALLVVDKSKVPADIVEGLASGKLTLAASNGNVYWAAGSGRTGIAAQLPMRPATPDEQAGVEQLLKLGQSVKSAQSAAVITTALSTVVVVAVVVAATTVIVSRINQVSAQVADMANALHLQDLREYVRARSYFEAKVKQSRDLLKPGLPAGELKDQAELCLNALTAQREEGLVFVRRLCDALDQHGGSNEQPYALALDFMIATLDWIPVSLNIERELCQLAGKPVMAESRRVDGAAEFRASLQQFRRWCETQYWSVARGRLAFVDTLVQRRPVLRGLMDSELHGFLLGDHDGASAFETLLRKDRPRPPSHEVAAASQVDETAARAR